MEAWGEIVERVRWQDLVDVALLTFLLFRVYLWARGTVALQVLGGIAGIVAAALLAQAGGLILTASVFRALGAVATLVIVVVFQDEIRRALRRLNPVSWWRRNRAAGDDDALETLAAAARRLARKRIGALIVIPGTEPIEEHARGGTALDAEMTPALLEAVFHSASPIHDGAAVLSLGAKGALRVARAGALLPLSSSRLPAQLGTRHRAAVGLTEECDATVLTVSEERGDISIVRGGRLEQVADPEGLGGRISAAMARPASSAPRAATSLGDDPRRARMLDALALVLILAGVGGAWYAVVAESATELSTDVPVELRSVPEGRTAEIIRPPSGQVRVRLRGPRQLLLEGRDEVSAWIDLDGVDRGRHRIEIRTAAPRLLEVVEVSPPTAVLRIRPGAPQ